MKCPMLFAPICFLFLTVLVLSQTSPSIPEEARRHFVMGTTLFKDAKTADDYSVVVNEFKQAADLAPQWPDARYNLGLAREAAGDYSGAMADLKLYQQFKLSDTEARTVQDKIYALEAKAGAAAKKKADEQTATHYTYTFYDDFSNNNNNWPPWPYAAKYGYMSIENGRLNINALADSQVGIVKEFPIHRTKDFEAEVTVRHQGAPDGHPFGIVFCSTQDLKSHYEFAISANGYYGIQYQESGGAWVYLKSGIYSQDINLGDSPNVLKITEKDKYIMLFVNNKLLEKLPFEGGYGKYFGFTVSRFAKVEFSNFRLSGEKE